MFSWFSSFCLTENIFHLENVFQDTGKMPYVLGKMSYGFHFCKTFFGFSFIQATVSFPLFLSFSSKSHSSSMGFGLRFIFLLRFCKILLLFQDY
ncbi:uncharacterized protein [Gossypium hirsutum]|uniref:Uncharacterized protein isoform X2 n=1 Tax=Gossypium hirsutum TaxID=3635 RepID=A0ABM2Z7D8_GOSHI|nr:uncharacterized protein LOC107935871 isoform X2 [Gossypium hirsutum]